MLKIAVCDDEKVIARQVSGMIKKHLPDCEIDEFLSGEDLLSAKKNFDIYFLDIQMKQQNGIKVARLLREHDENAVIVFITGAKEYVFEAFDVAALHYLLKPVDEKKLEETLNRAIREVQKKRDKEKKQLFIKKREKNITLNVDDILYLENEMRKIVAHTKRERITFYGVMSEIEKIVGTSFYRCHRGYLVNMAYVSEYDTNNILVNNGEKVYLSKDRYQDFVKQYMRYLRNGGVSHV